MDKLTFREALEKLVGATVRIQIEDPDRRGMAAYYEGVLLRVGLHGEVAIGRQELPYYIPIEDICEVELKNPDWVQRRNREMASIRRERQGSPP